MNNTTKVEIKNPKSTCYGLTNKCANGEYVLFADYDSIYLETLFKELKNIWKKFNKDLTNFLILESSPSILTKNGTLGSYHVISFVKLPYQKMREILSYMTVDDDFFRLPKRTAYRSNTLRISPKFEWTGFSDAETPDGEVLKNEPKFVTWFPEDKTTTKKKVSEAHLKTYKNFIPNFLANRYLITWDLDGVTSIELKKYDSLGV